MMTNESHPIPAYRCPPIQYWLRGEEAQNFGDFLSELFVSRAFVRPRVAADVFRVIGSTIDDWIIEDDLKLVGRDLSGKIGFWCCGARSDTPLSDRCRQAALFFGVRGPLTRDVLGLPRDTVMGDPGFVLPLLHRPIVRADTRGKALCVPHFSDDKSDEDILERSGAEVVVRPSIRNDLDALTVLLDQICSARFVLAGSLHAAVVACAYDIPFCFYDSGFLDVPFKWRDFAASIGLVPCFVDRVEDGIHLYETLLKTRIRKPPTFPLLAVAPFFIDHSLLLRSAVYDAGLASTSPPDGAKLELLSRRIDEAQVESTVEELVAQMRSLTDALAISREDHRQLQKKMDRLFFWRRFRGKTPSASRSSVDTGQR